MATSDMLFEGLESVGQPENTVSSVPKREPRAGKRKEGGTPEVAYPWEYLAIQYDVDGRVDIQQPDGWACLINSAPLWDKERGKAIIVCLWGRTVRDLQGD
jgi:hypothetical protein